MIYRVEKKPNWLIDLPDNLLNDENYIKIYDFFVIHSVVDGISARGRDLLYDYGWSNPWKKPYYLNKQLKTLTTDKYLLFSAQVYEQKKDSKQKELMDKALDKANMKIFPQYTKEKICIYDSKKNQILSTFAHIRNSITHCRFNVVDSEGTRVYCFEDIDTKRMPEGKHKVSARIVLFEKTLIDWIDLIKRGESIYSIKDKGSNLEI